MGLIPALLNVYRRNKVYENQLLRQQRAERKEADAADERRRNQALSTLQNQSRGSPFGDLEVYDPYRAFRQQFPE